MIYTVEYLQMVILSLLAIKAVLLLTVIGLYGNKNQRIHRVLNKMVKVLS